MKTFISNISKKEFPENEKVAGKHLRETILSVIREEHPEFGKSSLLTLSELNIFRQKYMEKILQKELGELGGLEKTVLKKIRDNEMITEPQEEEDRSFGQRMADMIADFGGSWKFIGFFFTFIFGWIALNIFVLISDPFDKYPFILLNLILSCLAALQAPIIMMSQNRQEEKDRLRSKKDYMIDLKSELEIRLLHEKMDHLLLTQQEEMLEIQQIQIEMMNDILRIMKANEKG